MITAVALSVELVQFPAESFRARSMTAALARAAHVSGAAVTTTEEYQGGADLLLLWGPGAPSRFEPMRRQLATGGHVLALDLAYWTRDTKVRVSIDAAHPDRWVMHKNWPRDRLVADRVIVSNEWDPSGPVIVAGLGRKARVQYGADTVQAWEVAMMLAAAARWSRPVLYRRKQADGPLPPGATLAADGPIERVLRGASILITWHSNVAVDAIRMGIPVICQHGAAAAVCPSTFSVEAPAPLLPAIRDRFLANLAWFQWAPSEAAGCWAFVRELLS